MKITNKTFLKLIVMVMVAFSLFTLLQAYYNAYLQLFLLVVSYFICRKAQGKTYFFLFSSVVFCVVMYIVDSVKGIGGVMDNIGLFLHYITWPVMFVCVTQVYDGKEIKQLLYGIIAICVVGDILSLIQLSINPEISRLLAGIRLGEERNIYYKKGVGGYGYVFAMAFLTFGVIRMLRMAEKGWERGYLITFLIINSLFILYASYTTAILLTLLLAGVAVISETRHKFRTVFLFILAAVVVGFLNKPIMSFCYDISQNLGLDWVARRFEQLLRAEEMDDLESLRRVRLYEMSWQTFLNSPVFGGMPGDKVGMHSQILDSLARYGMFSSLLIFFFNNCRTLCDKILGRNNLAIFYLSFFLFICIDTCSVMQIPVTVFFAVPLVAYLERGEWQK